MKERTQYQRPVDTENITSADRRWISTHSSYDSLIIASFQGFQLLKVEKRNMILEIMDFSLKKNLLKYA